MHLPELAKNKDPNNEDDSGNKGDAEKSEACEDTKTSKPKQKTPFFKQDKRFDAKFTPGKSKWTNKKKSLYEKHDFLTKKKVFRTKGKPKKKK